MVTKDAVIAKAKELGLTLTEVEIDQFVKDGKLPEASTTPEARKAEMLKKYTAEQLVEMLLDTRAEAKERRIEVRQLKEDAERLTQEIRQVSGLKETYPKVEKALKDLQEAEKARRKQAILKLDAEKQKALDYLMDVDHIPGDKFDSTLELFVGERSQGAAAPAPGGSPEIVLTDEQKKEASRMGLEPKAYLDVMKKRGARVTPTHERQTV